MSELTRTQIYGGKVVDLLEPKREDIDIDHIAKVLSRQYRFNGNTRTPITVAEHSIFVSDLLIDDGLAFKGLLHDAHEAFFGDISTPLKQAIKALTGQDPAKIISDKWDGIIFPAFGLTIPTEVEHKLIKIADKSALLHEAENLMWDYTDWDYFPNKKYKPMGEKKAFNMFMDRYVKLSEELEWI